MASKECRVRVELMVISERSKRCPGAKSKTSKSIKENGKPKDGGGKDQRRVKFFFLILLLGSEAGQVVLQSAIY